MTDAQIINGYVSPYPVDPMPGWVTALRDSAEPLWLFAYGSLMWNPEMPFTERRPALLRGYHRSFCLYSRDYRGTPERPGLVLGLDRGGACRGIAYRLPPDGLGAAIDRVDRDVGAIVFDDCHCEERSDEAIPGGLATGGPRLLRCARNDKEAECRRVSRPRPSSASAGRRNPCRQAAARR